MSQRFSYIKYDEDSTKIQETLKAQFEAIEATVTPLPEGRYKSLILTALEEAYAWTGKTIRDAQIAREVLPEHVPQRG